MQNWLERFKKIVIALLFFSIPSNLFLKFFESSAYVNGLLVDYLIPKFYLSDIFIICLLVLWFIEKLFFKKISSKDLQKNSLLVSLVVISIGLQVFVFSSIATYFYGLKLAEMAFLFIYLLHNQKILTQKIVAVSLVCSLGMQIIIGSYQSYFQTSLASYYWWGEPNLSNTIGLTKTTLGGIEKILPYGTTPHPNILGGTIVVFLLVIWKSIHPKKNLGKLGLALLTVASLYTVALSQSWSAGAALILGIVFIFLPKLYKSRMFSSKVALLTVSLLILTITPLLVFTFAQLQPTNLSLVRRNRLNQAAIKMINHNWLTGVGLNQFTAQVETYATSAEIVRFIQPVHHSVLLWIAETGLIGGTILTLLLIKVARSNKPQYTHIIPAIFILAPIMALDHYLLTTQTGMLLFIILATV